MNLQGLQKRIAHSVLFGGVRIAMRYDCSVQCVLSLESQR